MQYVTIGKGLKHSNPNSNHSKGIRIIQMQILTIRKGFEAVESKFDIEAFESQFEPLEMDSKHSNANSNHSKGIRSNQIQIRTTRKGFEAFKWKF